MHKIRIHLPTATRAIFNSVILLLTMTIASYSAESPHVVVSIKPLHSITSYLMQGVGKPELLVEGANSPHTYNLQPSKAKALQQADVIFWIGDQLETFLIKPLETVGADAKNFQALNFDGVVKLEYRNNEDLLSGLDHADLENETQSNNTDNDANHHEHESRTDPHIWLDPQNAIAIAKGITKILSRIDPSNSDTYAENLNHLISKAETLQANIQGRLGAVQQNGFIVMHDGLQYFENRFHLTNKGTLLENPQTAPGARRVREIREKIKQEKIGCVLSEPQFNDQLISLIAEGTSMKTSEVDVLGTKLTDGPALYFAMMRSVADSFASCLSTN